ncbi:hypothetical protein ACQ4PT_067472 [Festuca glaucescens]
MAAVDFDLRFTYVLAGWEGTAHDANVLADAVGRERGLQVPEGKYYLVDAGYGAKPGFIPPFRNVRYHLNEWGNNPVQNAEELFNLRHSSLRIDIERAFGSLKRRFKILDDAKPFFPFPVQVDIVVACCVLHNYALSQGIDEFILPEVTWTAQPIRSQTQQARDHRATVDRRQQIVNQMWADRQIMYEMDNFESTDASGSNTQGTTASNTQGTTASNTQTATGSKAKSLVCWTNSMSTMMLGFLADLVASGKRTSSGFKQCHHNQCAQVLNEQFKLSLNHDQISNHLKKWRKIWGRLIQLKNLSGALWDEDTCTIRLSEEHYAGHCAITTGKYAKSGNDPLSIDLEDEGQQSELNTSPNMGESAGKAAPKKKAKLVHNEDDPLVTTLQDGFKMMAEALIKSGGDGDDLPDGLWDALDELKGFDDEHMAHYYAHLVERPKIAKAFMTLSKQNKLVWVGRFMEKEFGMVYNLN